MLFGRRGQRFQQQASDTPSAGRTGDIDGVFDDAGISRARRHHGNGRPSHHVAGRNRHESVIRKAARVELFPVRSCRLKGCLPGLDTLRENRTDLGPIIGTHGPDQDGSGFAGHPPIMHMD